jgi:hypothetical protein
MKWGFILKKTKLIIITLCFWVVFAPVNANAKESREQLLESVLLNRYYPILRQTAESQFECENVITLKRLGKEYEYAPQFEVKVQLLTFEGAHNPPHDIVTVTIKDTLNEIEIMKVERKQNVSREEVIKTCAPSKKKFEAHKNKLQTP